MPSGRSIRVRTTSRAHAVCSARDWKPRTMRRQRGASARSTVRVVIVVIAISEPNAKSQLFYRTVGLYLGTMLTMAPAVSHMVAKNRASHRSNLPLHVMRVLAVAAALPIVASEWECPAGSISGSHGVAACCPAACGHCGGRGCEEREGGRQACCALDIQTAGRACNGAAPPCVPLKATPLSPRPVSYTHLRAHET